MIKKDKKGQIWYTDFIIAILIFVIVLVIYYEYMTNLSTSERSIVDELIADAKSISSSLVSEGNPYDWDNTTVRRIGITNNNMRLNQTKLDAFYNLNYNNSHRIFGTRFEFYIFFENKTRDRITITGGDTIGKQPVNPKHLVQITRLVIYNSEIIKMQVQLWN